MEGCKAVESMAVQEQDKRATEALPEIQAMLLSGGTVAQALLECRQVFLRTTIWSTEQVREGRENRRKRDAAKEALKKNIRQLHANGLSWDYIKAIPDDADPQFLHIWRKWTDFVHLDVDPYGYSGIDPGSTSDQEMMESNLDDHLAKQMHLTDEQIARFSLYSQMQAAGAPCPSNDVGCPSCHRTCHNNCRSDLCQYLPCGYLINRTGAKFLCISHSRSW